jgi:hypothetical protein
MVRIKFYWDIIDESFHIFSFVSWVRTKVAVDKGEMVWLSGVKREGILGGCLESLLY